MIERVGHVKGAGSQVWCVRNILIPRMVKLILRDRVES